MTDIQILEKLGAVLLSLLLLLNAVKIKQISKSWLNPMVLFSVVWFISSFFPLVILYHIPVNISTQIYITAGVLVFTNSFRVLKKNDYLKLVLNKGFYNVDSYFIKIIICFSVILSITALAYQVLVQNISFTDVFLHPIKSAKLFSELRYNQDLVYGYYTPIGLIFTYVPTILSGLLIASNSKKNNQLIAVLSFLPSIFIVITQSAKGALLLCVILFFSSFFVLKFRLIDKVKFLKSYFYYFTLMLFGLFTVSLFSFLSRGFNLLESTTEFFKKTNYLSNSYLLAHYYSFSDWLTAYLNSDKQIYNLDNNYFGYYTFNAVTRYFNTNIPYVRGVYNEYYRHENDVATNVYTIFRGLIMDFGLLSSIIILLIFGLISYKIYILFIKSSNLILLVTMIFITSFILTSFTVSLLSWTVIPLSFSLIFILLYLNKYCKIK